MRTDERPLGAVLAWFLPPRNQTQVLAPSKVSAPLQRHTATPALLVIPSLTDPWM